MMQRLLPHYLSGTMNAAAPDGAPPRRINNCSKIPCTLCLGEALMWESFVEGRFSWFRCKRRGSCPFLHSIYFIISAPCAGGDKERDLVVSFSYQRAKKHQKMVSCSFS